MENCYIVRLENNSLMCFYYLKNEGIICKSFENNKWQHKQTVINGCRSHFTVSLDKKGNIYLFCQDTYGNIVLCTNSSGSFSSKIILENKSQRIYTISINPIISDEGISIIYNVPNPEERNNFIVFQTLTKKGQWSPPIRIDVFYPVGSRLFNVTNVTNEHVLLFYQTITGEYNLGYREVTQNAQSTYHVFHSTKNQITDAAYLTSETTIFMIYIVKSMFSYQLIFRKKATSQFSNPVVVWEAQSIEKCLLFFTNEMLYITFTNNGQLFFSISSDMGNTFSRPQRYRNKFCLNPVKAVYLSQVKQNEKNYLLSEVYVDSASIWDIQLLPDLYEDFYPVTTVEVEVKSPPAQIPSIEQNKSEFNEELFVLQNKLNISEKKIDERDRQILSLSNTIKQQSNEIEELSNQLRLLKGILSLNEKSSEVESESDKSEE